jgi:hypothetical protein
VSPHDLIMFLDCSLSAPRILGTIFHRDYI